MSEIEKGLTVSGLDTFMNCERRYFYDYILRKPREPSVTLFGGTLYHKAIELVIKGQGAEEATKDAVAFLRNSPEFCEMGETFLKHLKYNLEAFKEFVLPYLDFDPDRIETRVDGDFRGRVDCVSRTTPIINNLGKIINKENAGCVIDFKLKFNAKSRRKLDSAYKSPQLAQYCLALGVSNAAFIEFCTDYQYSIRTSVARFTDSVLARWKVYFENQKTAILQRGLDEKAFRLADPSHPLCSPDYCPHFLDCPGGLNYGRIKHI